MSTKIAKIDFIICEHLGSWFTESHNIPSDIAIKSNEEIVTWAKSKSLISGDYFYVGVYWNDPNAILN